MKHKNIFLPSVLSCLFLMSLFIAGCDKDDDAPRPGDAVTLNMHDELNGKTRLGATDVYIDASNNFSTDQYLISDAGSASGVGAQIALKAGNLVPQAAVIPGHVYHIFDKRYVRDFPSGAKAIQAKSAYFQTYVDSPITIDGTTCGAVVEYVSLYSHAKGLPEAEQSIGTLTHDGASVELALPQSAECVFTEHSGSGEAGAFNVSTADGKLTIRLLKSPNQVSGPWGTYYTYIRLGDVYTAITVSVK